MKNRFDNVLLGGILMCCLARFVLLSSVVALQPDGARSLYWDVDAQRHYAAACQLLAHGATAVSWDVPLFQEVVAVSLRIFPHYAVPLFLNLFFFLLSALVVFHTAACLGNRRNAWWATLLYCAYPSFIVYSFLPFPDPLFVLLFMTAVYCLVRYIRDQRYRFAGAAGICAGLCIMTKEAAVILS